MKDNHEYKIVSPLLETLSEQDIIEMHWSIKANEEFARLAVKSLTKEEKLEFAEKAKSFVQTEREKTGLILL
jgi:hypothetical protein